MCSHLWQITRLPRDRKRPESGRETGGEGDTETHTDRQRDSESEREREEGRERDDQARVNFLFALQGPTIMDAWNVMLKDKKILLVGAVQSLFEVKDSFTNIWGKD